MVLEWLDNLTKPFVTALNPLAERIGNFLGHRKPRLFIHPEPMQCVWCIANQGTTEMIQLLLFAGFTQDDPKVSFSEG